MTKLKSKKITKSTFAIIIMAIALIALLAFGGTYAYFTATSADKTGTITTGKISLKSGTVTSLDKEGVMPGEELFKAVSFSNESTGNSYVFVKIDIKAGDTDLKDYITVTTAEGWTKYAAESNGTVYWKEVDAISAEAAEDVAFCTGVVFSKDATTNYHEGAFDSKGTDLMGKEFTVTIQAKAIQKSGFTSETEAYAQCQWYTAD